MKFKNFTVFEDPSKLEQYKIKYALIISFVPFLCVSILMCLFFIFIRLNLYFLESNGLIINEMIRQAYYDQVFQHVSPLLGMIVALFFGSGIIGYIFMHWATSPFIEAKSVLQELLIDKKSKEKSSRQNSRYWMAENPEFTLTMQEFVERILTGKPVARSKKRLVKLSSNLRYITKFVVLFTGLSIITAYILGIFFNSIYDKIVSLALKLLHTPDLKSHYFVAQQEILSDSVWILMFIAVIAYFIIALKIDQYMQTMVFVFTRAVREDRFPIQLRYTDIYHDLADTMNHAMKIHQQKNGHESNLSKK